jgi:hypothetical protein
MGFRFQKRIRLFKGLTLNLSKTGTSLSAGGPGASINLKGDKVTGTVGVPGSGLSYRETVSTTKGGSSRKWWILIAIVAVVFVMLLTN